MRRCVIRLRYSHAGSSGVAVRLQSPCSPSTSGRQHWWIILALRHHTVLFLVEVRSLALVVIERESVFLRGCLLVGAFRNPLLREESLDLLVEHNTHIYDEKEHDNT